MDFGASHNLMPKVVMDELGLEITREYQDLYSFGSKKSPMSWCHQRPYSKSFSVTYEMDGNGYCCN